MSERAGRRRTLPPPSAPPFPRAVATWVGRVAELTRGAQLMASETLHLVYGVGGVGKSELVYKLVEEAMRQPRWAEASPVVLVARPNTGAAHLAAALKSQLGARRKRITFSATGASAMDDLADIAQALEARPYIVFLDDLHHLALAAGALGGAALRAPGCRVDVLETPDDAVAACVAQVMRGARFPRSDDGVSFTYPFVF